jgi:hypothetical protein
VRLDRCDDPFCRPTVKLAVVTLAQAPVEEDRDRCIGERDLGGLGSAAQIGGEDGADPVAATPPAELRSELSAAR